MVKRVGKYELGRTLGEGTFGKVKHAINTETGDHVAIKVLDKEKIQKQNMSDQIRKEISVMKLIKQRHVVELKEVLHSRTKIFIVLELVTGGELFDRIVAEGRFAENTARNYFHQLVSGVEYCHSQGVCHRDLKPENLLLDEKSLLKISDFGLSYLYGAEGEAEGTRHLLHTTCGTPNYVAPEVLADKGYDGKAADLWSCGVILYVLLAGFLPFDEPTMSGLFRKILKAEFNFPSWFTSGERNLISRILVTDPKRRMTIRDMKNDPWFSVGFQEEVQPGPIAMPKATDLSMSVKEVSEMEAKTAASASRDDRKKSTGPQAMNAFEVIGMLGGFDVTPLFQKDGNHVKRHTQFSSEVPPKDILKRVSVALSELGAGHKVLENLYKIKVATSTNKGLLTFTCQVYKITPGLFLVEFQRGRGDILEFQKFYKRLYDQVSDIIHKDGSPPV